MGAALGACNTSWQEQGKLLTANSQVRISTNFSHAPLLLGHHQCQAVRAANTLWCSIWRTLTYLPKWLLAIRWIWHFLSNYRPMTLWQLNPFSSFDSKFFQVYCDTGYFHLKCNNKSQNVLKIALDYYHKLGKLRRKSGVSLQNFQEVIHKWTATKYIRLIKQDNCQQAFFCYLRELWKIRFV